MTQTSKTAFYRDRVAAGNYEVRLRKGHKCVGRIMRAGNGLWIAYVGRESHELATLGMGAETYAGALAVLEARLAKGAALTTAEVLALLDGTR